LQVNAKHRLFFALEPDDRVRKEVHAIQKKLPGCGRAVRPAQFHITLAFLGMQSSPVIPLLCGLASTLTFEPCNLVLDQVGRFPRAGVLWLGASTIPEALEDFLQSLIEVIESAGIDRDQKAWQPHVTLYRRLRNSPSIMDTVAVNWPLNGFSLIESVSVNNGVEYHRQGHWKSGSSVN
jgi:2'-5' RNA ligase